MGEETLLIESDIIKSKGEKRIKKPLPRLKVIQICFPPKEIKTLDKIAWHFPNAGQQILDLTLNLLSN